ncbi:MAG: hypothetical protein ACJ741_06595 [Pyrinomonadaceae bacterium]
MPDFDFSDAPKDAPKEFDFSDAPAEGAKPRQFKDYRDLSAFAGEHGFTVTSTTGGRHNAGSAHYAGHAVDVRTRDKQPAEVEDFIQKARDAGLRVLDERTRPAGQKVWGGPNVHIQTGGAVDRSMMKPQFDFSDALQDSPRQDALPLTSSPAPDQQPMIGNPQPQPPASSAGAAQPTPATAPPPTSSAAATDEDTIGETMPHIAEDADKLAAREKLREAVMAKVKEHAPQAKGLTWQRDLSAGLFSDTPERLVDEKGHVWFDSSTGDINVPGAASQAAAVAQARRRLAQATARVRAAKQAAAKGVADDPLSAPPADPATMLDPERYLAEQIAQKTLRNPALASSLEAEQRAATIERTAARKELAAALLKRGQGAPLAGVSDNPLVAKMQATAPRANFQNELNDPQFHARAVAEKVVHDEAARQEPGGRGFEERVAEGLKRAGVDPQTLHVRVGSTEIPVVGNPYAAELLALRARQSKESGAPLPVSVLELPEGMTSADAAEMKANRAAIAHGAGNKLARAVGTVAAGGTQIGGDAAETLAQQFSQQFPRVMADATSQASKVLTRLNDTVPGFLKPEEGSLGEYLPKYLANRSKIYADAANYRPAPDSFPAKVTRSLMDAGIDVLKLAALAEASGFSMPVVMAGEAAAAHADKSPAQIAKESAKAYALGRVLEFAPAIPLGDGVVKKEIGARLGSGASNAVLQAAVKKYNDPDASAADVLAEGAGGFAFGLGFKGKDLEGYKASIASALDHPLAAKAVDAALSSPKLSDEARARIADLAGFENVAVANESGTGAMEVYSRGGKRFARPLTAEEFQSIDPSKLTGERRGVKNVVVVPDEVYDAAHRAQFGESFEPARETAVAPINRQLAEDNAHHSNFQPRNADGTFVEGKPVVAGTETDQASAAAGSTQAGAHTVSPVDTNAAAESSDTENDLLNVPQTGARTPVPESPETLAAQFESAASPESPRVAVLVTLGEETSAPQRGFIQMSVEGHGTLYLSRKKIARMGMQSLAEIRQFIDANGFEPLIGKVSPVGDTSQGASLRTEDAQGNELSTSVVTSPEAAEAQAATDRAQFPQAATHELMPTQEAATRRRDGGAKGAPIYDRAERRSRPRTDEDDLNYVAAQLRAAGGDLAREDGRYRISVGGTPYATATGVAEAVREGRKALDNSELAAGARAKTRAGNDTENVPANPSVDKVLPETSQGNVRNLTAEGQLGIENQKNYTQLGSPQTGESVVGGRAHNSRIIPGESASPAPAQINSRKPLEQDGESAQVKNENSLVQPEPGWQHFPEHMGSLGVPRPSMPQIKSEHRGAMVQFLKGRGITHTQEEIAPDQLKPSQAEYSPEKVEKARGYTGEQRSILVSADNHVIDGHHQWMKDLEDAPQKPVPVIRLDAPAHQLLIETARFPSSGVDEGQGFKVPGRRGLRVEPKFSPSTDEEGAADEKLTAAPPKAAADKKKREQAAGESQPPAAPNADARAGGPKPADMDALKSYARSVVEAGGARSIALVGSVAARGAGNDVDLLYDLGNVDLPKSTRAAADRVGEIIETSDAPIDLDSYDTFVKAGDRHFHLDGGAGRTFVENTDYAADQQGKPRVLLAGADAKPDDLSAIFDDEFDKLFNEPAAPAQPARSMADVAKGLRDVFDSPLKMAHGGVPAEEFDEARYAKVKPLFEAGVAHTGVADPREAIRALLLTLSKDHGFEPELIKRMKPYVVRFMEESAAGEKSVDAGASQAENAGKEVTHDADARLTHGDGQDGDEGSRPADVQAADGERGTRPRGADEGEVRPRDARRDGAQSAGGGGDLEPRPAGESPRADDGEQEGGRGGAGAGDRVPAEYPSDRERDSLVKHDYLAPEGSLAREGSWLATARTNLQILRLVKQLDSEGRLATPEEQALLVKFTGWGASEIANNLFPGHKYYGEIRPEMARDENWKALATEAKELFTDEELKTAARSTQYAHYTSEKIVRGVWDALAQLGFTGGKILEPGMGVGLFAVAAPKNVIAKSRYTGVEMDHLTAAVARQVLQNQNVLQADFVRQRFPNDFFDVAIGNPPFSSTRITDDPAYKRQRFMLHDYFFAKSIDKVRPGGLLVFVTSKGTMDKLDPKMRGYIAERADLLGAIRLPQTAFKQNAGTEVVTDVIFLRKRLDGEAPAGEKWLGHGEVTGDNKGGESHTGLVNEYFVAHPEMVLGSHSFAGKMRSGDNEYTVTPREGDIEEHFREAVKRLPAAVYTNPAKADEIVRETRERDYDPKLKKEGALYVHDDGTLMKVVYGSGVALSDIESVSAAGEKFLKDYVSLRGALKAAQHDQLKEGDWETSLAALNKSYDAFVKRHGNVLAFTTQERTHTDDDGAERTRVTRRFKNARLLALDVESPLVEALERITEDGQIVKSAMLERRTIKPPSAPEVRTLSDALAVSLDQTGALNLAHVAEVYQPIKELTPDEVAKELGDAVYEVPGGTWQMADEYLSGFVIDKLEEAEAAARLDPRYERNVEALLKVQPKPLETANITVGLGAAWIPPEIVSDFAAESLGMGAGAVTFQPATNVWSVSGASGSGSQSRRSAANTWGTADRSPEELLEAALNQKTIKVFATVEKKKVLDVAASAAANDVVKKMRDAFKQWIWSDAGRAADLSARYNRQFNNIAPRSFNGSHLTLPGLSAVYKLYDHQKRAVWRVLQSGNTYLAHAVGAGKTLEMIVSGMEQKRLGLISKPMYVVPNHMLKQFSSEFMDAYPMANVLVADETNFAKEQRKRFVAQAALNDLDAVVIGHTAFGLLRTKEETSREIVDGLVSDLRDAIGELDESDRSDQRTIKKLEARIETIERRFAARAGDESRDDVVDFEDLGIDFLFVDEAHQFRKLDFVTNRDQVKGVDPEGSRRALDLLIKARWLDSQRPGRSLVMASGTPVTNTLAELYSIQRYMDPRELENSGTSHFDAWAAQFGEVVGDYEMNAAGKYELVERFSRFVNIPELMKRVRSFMDVLTLPQLGSLVDLPTVKGGTPEIVVVPPTPEVTRYLKEELDRRIQISRDWKPSRDQPGNPDPLINIITDGRLAAIDMRFVDRGAKDDPDSKLNRMIDSIIEGHKKFATEEYRHKQTGAPDPVKGAAQIVFSAVGFGDMIAHNRGFDAKRFIMKRLTEAGVPASEVAFMSDYKTASAKESMFQEMRQGRVRILIGSPANMGTGVNVQKRLKVLHFLSPPWYPADVEQPDGRIIRQGNQNDEIEIRRYATKGTYDSTAWSMIARKSRAIEQAMTGDDSQRTLEDITESSKYEMASALAAGDARAIKLAQLRREVEGLERSRAGHFDEQINLKNEQRRAEKDVKYFTERASDLEKAAEVVGGYVTTPAMTVSGRKLEKRAEIGDAIKQAWAAAVKKNRAEVIKTGKPLKVDLGLKLQDKFPLTVTVYETAQGIEALPSISVTAGVSRKLTDEALRDPAVLDSTGLVTRAVNVLNSMAQERRDAGRHVEEERRKLKQIASKLGAPFAGEQELYEKTAELSQLKQEMAGDKNDAAPAADAPLKMAGRADALSSENAADLAPLVTSTRDANLVTVNPHGQELLRRAFEQAKLDDGKMKESDAPEASFAGTFLDARQARRTVKTLRAFAARMKDAGYSAEEIAPVSALADSLRDAMKDGKGTAVVKAQSAPPAAEPHEFFHAGSYAGADERALEDRHARLGDLAGHEAVRAWRDHYGTTPEYRGASDAVAVEEAAATIAGGDYGKLGLTDEAAAEYLAKWFDSYVERNGAQSVDEFARQRDEVKQIIEAAKARAASPTQTATVEAADGRADDGLQRPPSERGQDAGREAGGGRGVRARPEGETGGDGRGSLKPRSLPETLRAQGLSAADEMYETYPNKAALQDGKTLLEQLGFDAAESLLRSDVALGPEHVALSKMMQRALLREASDVSETDVDEATRLRDRAQSLASDLAAKMTKGGQFINAAQLLDNSVEDVMAAAAKVARERGRELTPAEAERVHRAGEELERASAEGEIVAGEVSGLRAELEAAQESLRRAEAGEMGAREREALDARLAEMRAREKDRTAEGARLAGRLARLRESVSRLAAKEKTRQRRIDELEGRIPPRERKASQRARRTTRVAVRSRAIELLSVGESDLMARALSGLGGGTRAQADGALKMAQASPRADFSLDDDTFDALAQLGALKLLRSQRGTLTVADFKRQMVEQFGRQILPDMDRLHAESVRVAAETVRQARRERELERIAEREGNEDLTREELEEIADEERQQRKRLAAIQAEHARAATKYRQAVNPKSPRPPLQGPSLGEGTGRKAGPRIEDAPFVGARLSEGLKSGPPRADALTLAIARHATSDLDAVAAAKLSRPGMTPERFASEMKSEHDMTGKAMREAYKAGGRVLEAARADVNAGRQVAAALKERAASSREELDRALAALQEARAARARAQAAVAAQLRRLQRTAFEQRAASVARAVKGVPMAIQASADFSNLFRQGGVAVWTHPGLLPRFAEQTVTALKDSRFARNVDQIERHPDFPLWQRMGIDFTVAGAGAHRGEEMFEGADVLHRVPVVKQTVGKVVAKSDQAFGGGLDHVRAALADLYVGQLRAQGVTFAKAPRAYKDVARLINIMTGRADVGEHNSRLTQALLAVTKLIGFSPRFRLSRLQMLSLPFNRSFWHAHPAARRIVYKEWARYFSTLGGTLVALAAMGSLTGLWSVALDDPDSADWLKLKVGKLRLDLTAGHQTQARFLARLVMEGYRRASGQVTGEMAAQEALSLTGRWVRSGEDPVASLVTDWWTGKDFNGNDFHWGGWDGAIASRLMPLSVGNAAQIAREQGGTYAGANAAADALGFGASVYDDRGAQPKTRAEKLASRFVAAQSRASDKPRPAPDVQRRLDDVRARARAGADVTRDLAALTADGTLTAQQAKGIAGTKGMTLLQSKIKELPLATAEHVLKYATPEERESVKAVLRAKELNEVERDAREEKRAQNPRAAELAAARAKKAQAGRKVRQERRYGAAADKRFDFSDAPR